MKNVVKTCIVGALVMILTFTSFSSVNYASTGSNLKVIEVDSKAVSKKNNLRVNVPEKILPNGVTRSYKGTVFYNKKKINATKVTWTSSNTDVATIGKKTSMLETIGIGKTTITAKYKGKKYAFDLTVIENPTGEAIVECATQFIGNPYKYGGISLTDGCDCSGFVYSLYKNYGFTIPRVTIAMKASKFGRSINVDESKLKAGDIILYEVANCGIYDGNGKVIMCSSTIDGINNTKDWNYMDVAKVIRIL